MALIGGVLILHFWDSDCFPAKNELKFFSSTLATSTNTVDTMDIADFEKSRWRIKRELCSGWQSPFELIFCKYFSTSICCCITWHFYLNKWKQDRKESLSRCSLWVHQWWTEKPQNLALWKCKWIVHYIEMQLFPHRHTSFQFNFDCLNNCSILTKWKPCTLLNIFGE